MPDGTIDAGTSPETGQPMYRTHWSTFNVTANYAAKLDAPGHRDWRLPTIVQLEVVFNSRALIGGFNRGSLYANECYWSSTKEPISFARGQHFTAGIQHSFNRT